MEIDNILEKSKMFTRDSKKSTFSLPKSLTKELSEFCSEKEINKSKFVSLIIESKLEELKTKN